MAITKIQSESMNLADTYAFTGTVTGAGEKNTPVFRAHQSSSQNIDSNTATKVSFNAETFDPQGTFDSSRFTPAVTGKYLLNASIRMPSATDYNQLGAIIYKNGSGAAYQWQNSDGTSGNPSAFVTTLIDADSTSDYFEVYFYHKAGSTKGITTGLENTWFEGFLVST